MARFYTNPFTANAPMVSQVSATEPKYDGVTLLAQGESYESWSRTVTYSDGTERVEELKRRPLGDWSVILPHISGKGLALR